MADPSPRRVLIVEDSRTVAFALKAQLGAEGLDCAVCHDLTAALARVGQGDFDLVLLDLFLPDVQGLEGLAALKAVRPDLAVVILTGHDDAELAVQALQAGAQDYLIKGEYGQLLMRTLAFAYERNTVRKQLEDLNEEKDRFLSMAAHDLRNPLTAISGISNLLVELTRGVLDEEQRELLQHIEDSSGFMLQLIDDLLDISTIELGHIELARDELDLARVVEGCVARHRHLAGPKSIELACVGAFEPVRLLADERRLVQVLDNLLSNAIKYSPAGTTTTVRVGLEGDDAVFSVSDEGPGIAEEEQPRLFEPFERASTRATGGEKSTGLGLAITKKIVEAHGGRVRLRSAVGAGATFEVRLPRSSALQISLDPLPQEGA